MLVHDVINLLYQQSLLKRFLEGMSFNPQGGKKEGKTNLRQLADAGNSNFKNGLIACDFNNARYKCITKTFH